jgi:hypothetical protein
MDQVYLTAVKAIQFDTLTVMRQFGVAVTTEVRHAAILVKKFS